MARARSKSAKVAIIMGSSSDWPKLSDAGKVLDQFAISYVVKVLSAHRMPDEMAEFAKSAASKKIEVIIAGAGGAAHLPGMVASHTHLPVIGVPVALKQLKGLDSLLSIAQMPAGVPVATVGIDNATNAALLAARILALADEKLTAKLKAHKVKIRKDAIQKAKKLR
jgi:5-(carboxyamino)imidazole ribonucleotide mutase